MNALSKLFAMTSAATSDQKPQDTRSRTSGPTYKVNLSSPGTMHIELACECTSPVRSPPRQHSETCRASNQQKSLGADTAGSFASRGQDGGMEHIPRTPSWHIIFGTASPNVQQ